ncbi:MAG: TetR/AcrR family transcriptional regulator [Pseudomonadota bacterium]|nr:TetR/AcrR family transcriptional regulator [Pseudomonadota bacterium]
MTDAILEAALLSFANRGFAATTIRQLTIDLGVTRRSILQRFPSTDDLLLAVATRDTENFLDALEAMPIRQSAFESDFRNICKKLWDRGRDMEEAKLLRTYFGEMSRLPQLADVVREFYLALAKVLEDKVAEAKVFGRFPDFASVAVADCAISMIISTPRIRNMVLDDTINDDVRGAELFERNYAFLTKLS